MSLAYYNRAVGVMDFSSCPTAHKVHYSCRYFMPSILITSTAESVENCDTLQWTHHGSEELLPPSLSLSLSPSFPLSMHPYLSPSLLHFPLSFYPPPHSLLTALPLTHPPPPPSPPYHPSYLSPSPSLHPSSVHFSLSLSLSLSHSRFSYEENGVVVLKKTDPNSPLRV